jgi:integrase/recombinase XerD
VLSEVERATLLGFLTGHRGQTRDAYTLDLRQFTTWCWQHHQHLFDVRRVDIECFARDLEERGNARATIARRLCTVVGFYRYAEEEGVIEHSPGVHIRRPRIGYESHVACLDRKKLGAMLVAAGISSPRDHALVSLLALNGLRVSEAIGANIEALGFVRAFVTLAVRSSSQASRGASRQARPAAGTHTARAMSPRAAPALMPSARPWPGCR